MQKAVTVQRIPDREPLNKPLEEVVKEVIQDLHFPERWAQLSQAAQHAQRKAACVKPPTFGIRIWPGLSRKWNGS